MKIYKDSNYGADRDGNRGITVYEYKLTDDDNYDIAELLYEEFTSGTYKGKTYVELNDIEFDVYYEDYLTELLVLASEDKDLPWDDEDFISYMNEVKEFNETI